MLALIASRHVWSNVTNMFECVLSQTEIFTTRVRIGARIVIEPRLAIQPVLDIRLERATPEEAPDLLQRDDGRQFSLRWTSASSLVRGAW